MVVAVAVVVVEPVLLEEVCLLQAFPVLVVVVVALVVVVVVHGHGLANISLFSNAQHILYQPPQFPLKHLNAFCLRKPKRKENKINLFSNAA